MLLGPIMAVMKAHLSPSWHNRIIHMQRLWNEDEYVLFKGQVWYKYEVECLNAIIDAETDLLMYLLSRMSEMGDI